MKQTDEQYKYQHAESKLHVKCSECNADIPARDVNITDSLAKCDDCNNIFRFDKDIFPEWQRSKPEMFIPEGMEVLKLPSELDIQFDWYNGQSKKGMGFKTFFTFMWNIMLMPFVFGAFSNGQYEVILFASIHILVGLGLIGNLVSTYINKTNISVTKRFIEIKQKPIPSFLKRNIKIPTNEIAQLYVTRYVSSTTNGVANHAHALYAITKDGNKHALIKGMNKETQLYIEQEIELFLDIEDEPIRGEVKHTIA